MRTDNNKQIPLSDDLDYLAQAGYEKLPLQPGDLQELYSRIDKRIYVEKGAIFKQRLLLASVILVAGALLWYFTYYFSHTGSSAVIVKNKTQAEKTTSQNTGTKKTRPVTETVSQETSLNNKKAHTAYSREHFTKENTGRHLRQDIQAETLPLQSVTSLEEQLRPTPKEELELLPNAPVIYLYDLKVSDYQRLYFTKSEPFTIKNGGLSSIYENSNTYAKPKTREEPVYTADMVLKDGLKAFAKQDYSRAQSHFSLLLDLNKKDVNAQFYAALCAYHLAHTVKAAVLLKQVLANENNVFDQEAEWYLALTLLKNNEIEDARELLLKINKKSGFYANKAGEKLNDLK